MASREAGRRGRFHLHPWECGAGALARVNTSLAAAAMVFPKAVAVGNSVLIINSAGIGCYAVVPA
jgi:hypothetical protein